MCPPNYSGLVSCLLHNAVSPYLQAAPKHTASLFDRVLLATFGPSYERNSPKFHEFLSFLPTSSLPYHHPRWIMDSSCGVLPVEHFPLTLLTSSSLSPLLLLKATVWPSKWSNQAIFDTHKGHFMSVPRWGTSKYNSKGDAMDKPH